MKFHILYLSKRKTQINFEQNKSEITYLKIQELKKNVYFIPDTYPPRTQLN